jgi:hypothetical protein
MSPSQWILTFFIISINSLASNASDELLSAQALSAQKVTVSFK